MTKWLSDDFFCHSLQRVCGVCVWREKLHWWHQTALPPTAQTAMRKRARESLQPVRQSPQRLWPRGLARRPSGSPWTPKTRGQSSAGTHALSQVMCSCSILISAVYPLCTFPFHTFKCLYRALFSPFPSKLLPAQFYFHFLCFSSDIPITLSVPSFLISPWPQSIQTSSQTVCCSWGPLLWSVECFHEVVWRILKGHNGLMCHVFFVCLMHLTECDVTIPCAIIQDKPNAWSTQGASAVRVCRGNLLLFFEQHSSTGASSFGVFAHFVHITRFPAKIDLKIISG